MLEMDLAMGRVGQEEFEKKKVAIENLRNDPATKMKIAQQKIDMMTPFVNQGNPMFQGEMTRGLKRWQAKYDSLGAQVAKQQEKAADRQFQMAKLAITETGKNLRAASKDGKVSQKQIDDHREVAMQHLVGWGQQEGLSIQIDPEGGIAASMTEAEIAEFTKEADKLGFSVYASPTEEGRDLGSWWQFKGKEPLYSISIVPKFADKGGEASGEAPKSGLQALIDKGREIQGGQPKTENPAVQIPNDREAINALNARDKKESLTEQVRAFEASEDFQKPFRLDIDPAKSRAAKRKVKKQTKKSFLRKPPGN